MKNPPVMQGTGGEGLIPGLGRSPEEGMQPTPAVLSGESHGQRRLAGYSPWGHKEPNMTEHTPPYTQRSLKGSDPPRGSQSAFPLS